MIFIAIEIAIEIGIEIGIDSIFRRFAAAISACATPIAIPICCRHLRLRYVDSDLDWHCHPTTQQLNFLPSHLPTF